MQIADIARQYANTSAPADSMNGTRGVEKLVSSVRELTAGNIFEGTVNSISGGKVVLGLSNGTELAARLDANMQLVKGQSMFFQVKSNDGATIAIRPYTVDGAGVNLTLLNALKAASLPVTEKYLNMANTMMQEHLPIDKNSMAQMARILMANPDMSVNTIVQMKKLNIPITNEMAAQFENYMDDSNAVHKALNSFISELPATLSGKDLPIGQLKAFDSQLLQILADGMDAVPQTSEIGNQAGVDTSAGTAGSGSAESMGTAGVMSADGNITGVVPEGGSIETTGTKPSVPENIIIKDTGIESGTQEKSNLINEGSAVTENENAAQGTEAAKSSAQPGVKTLASQEAVVKLLHGLFGDTGITKEDSPANVLNKLSNFILNGEQVSKEALNQLFSSKEMRVFLRDVMEGQMYLTPEDVAGGEKVKKLYERLDAKTQSLENLLANTGLKDTPLAQTITNVRGNIDFMNQLNQTYTYVQIPLKMSGQKASGQLYVYTNKRELNDPERDLTAFLHLDMDFLGSTDVSVRLHRKDVDTKFYMDNDAAYALIKAHMPELQERLRRKGFNAKVYVEKEGKQVNFVKDFLKKDTPSTAQVHRYSFDVRA